MIWCKYNRKKEQVERLNLFTEDSTMFGTKECFGDMS